MIEDTRLAKCTIEGGTGPLYVKTIMLNGTIETTTNIEEALIRSGHFWRILIAETSLKLHKARILYVIGPK